MPRLLAALVIAGVFLAPIASADVTVWVQPDVVRQGEPFQIIVEARGGRVSEPQLPEIPDLAVNGRPNITEDRWSLNALTQEHAKVRGYRAYAKRSGVIEIPPVSVDIDGNKERSKAVQLTVLEPGEARTDPQEDTVVWGAQSAPAQGAGDLSWDDLLLAYAEADKTTVYVQEPILLTMKRLEIIHPRVQVRVVEQVEPGAQGFYVIPVERQAISMRPEMVNLDGFSYRVTEEMRILYPTAPGELTIGPWVCRGLARRRDGLRFIDNELEASSKPIRIQARPLPPPPRAFSGAVGQFEIDAALESSQTVQGVPVKLAVRIMGKGNPHAIGQPPFPSLEGASVTEPDTATVAIPNPNAPAFEKSFTYRITPVRPGEVSVPTFEFVYFDPELGNYVTKRLGPFVLSAAPASETSQRFVDYSGVQLQEQNGVSVVGHDIHPIVTTVGPLGPDTLPPLAAPVAIVAPALAYAGFAAALARRRRFAQDSGFARAYQARNKARKKLKEAHASKDPAQEVCHALIGFVADKFDVPQAGLTAADVEQLLSGAGVDSDLAANTLEILRKCERARYASAAVSPDEAGALAQGGFAVVDQLESFFRRRRQS